MKLVVGLGNPGKKYSGTRHNVGFDVLNEFAVRNAAETPRKRFEAEVSEIVLGGERVILAAPQTFMNLSGRSVRAIVDFFKLTAADVLVVCDDLNLDCGQLRLRESGSAGGQKGLQNIIDQLGTQEVARLRVGIGRPPPSVDSSNYVLSRFSGAEGDRMAEVVPKAAEAVESWVLRGAGATMNEVNVKPPKQTPET